MTNETDSAAKPSPVPVIPKIAGTPYELMLRWLFEQGFSSVLLVLILLASYYGIPKVLIPAVNDGYKANADSLRSSAEMFTKSNEKMTEMYIQASERNYDNLNRRVDALERSGS